MKKEEKYIKKNWSKPTLKSLDIYNITHSNPGTGNDGNFTGANLS
jgi:hypothetical protein